MSYTLKKYATRGTESLQAHSLAIKFLRSLEKKIAEDQERYGWLDNQEWEIIGIPNGGGDGDLHHEVYVKCCYLISKCGNYKVDLQYKVAEEFSKNSSKLVVKKHVSSQLIDHSAKDW